MSDMTTATEELINLRVSVARIAQLLDLHEAIPGSAGRAELSYELLRECAIAEERGWNTLCSSIISEIIEVIATPDDDQPVIIHAPSAPQGDQL